MWRERPRKWIYRVLLSCFFPVKQFLAFSRSVLGGKQCFWRKWRPPSLKTQPVTQRVKCLSPAWLLVSLFYLFHGPIRSSWVPKVQFSEPSSRPKAGTEDVICQSSEGTQWEGVNARLVSASEPEILSDPLWSGSGRGKSARTCETRLACVVVIETEHLKVLFTQRHCLGLHW